MRRHALALLIQPYKNTLVPQDKLREAINICARKLVDIACAYPNIRLNLIFPAYMLSHIDTLLLTELREVQKRGCLEWLTPGYTEPFLSFSPLWLSGANIRAGLDTFEELLSVRPVGYTPPFSNWEPSCLDTFRACGLQYAVVSRAVIPHEAQNYCGYWITEHMGTHMAVFPAHMVHHYTAPANISDWIEGNIAKDPGDDALTKLVAINYLVPLVHDEEVDPYRWLQSLAQVMDNLLVRYQVIRLQEFQSLSYPLGLQYLPPQLVFKRDDETTIPYFSNYLHTFEQVGIMQRKMMEIADRLEQSKDAKDTASLIRQLFFAQDINRYLPAKTSGFTHLRDRLWTYAKMIDIETALHEKERIKGGRIRIADLLRNGTKSIVLTNATIKACIDHKNGGQVFELDFRDRSINLFAGYAPQTHSPPRIIVAGKSCAAFVDHFLDEKCRRADFMGRLYTHRDEFTRAEFNYTVKKSAAGAKAVLGRQCAVSIDGKNYPLAVEKVFGIEGETPALSFVYQLANHSLTAYRFKFAVEFTFTLPGALTNEVKVVCGDRSYGDLQTASVDMAEVLKWTLYDDALGASIQFVLQKPVEVWIFPARRLEEAGQRHQGITCVLSTPVSMGENARWSLIGKIICRKLKTKGTGFDEI